MENSSIRRQAVEGIKFSCSMVWGNEREYWEGTYKNHKIEITKDVPTDTYYYRIEFRGMPTHKGIRTYGTFKAAVLRVKEIVDNVKEEHFLISKTK